MKEAGVRSELFLYEEQPHGFFNTAKYDETVKEMDRFLVSLGFLVENLKD
jgi:acetyl esterase/lipase